MVLTRSLQPLPSLALGFALLVGGCKSPTPPHLTDEPALVLVGTGEGTTRMDPVEIAGARIQDDVLHLELRHGGGCAPHDFSLLHSGIFVETLPVQTYLSVAHDAHGDPCRALLMPQVEFDLTPLKRAYQRAYAQHGVLVLHLQAPGFTSPSTTSLRYEF